jgi:hypothetical protein
VGQSLNDIAERILAIDQPTEPPFQEAPNPCPLLAAVFDDSGDEPFEVGISDAEMKIPVS